MADAVKTAEKFMKSHPLTIKKVSTPDPQKMSAKKEQKTEKMSPRKPKLEKPKLENSKTEQKMSPRKPKLEKPKLEKEQKMSPKREQKPKSTEQKMSPKREQKPKESKMSPRKSKLEKEQEQQQPQQKYYLTEEMKKYLSRPPENYFQEALVSLLNKNVLGQNKVFDLSNYKKDTFSSIKIVQKPKTQRTKVFHNSLPLISTTKENIDLFLSDLK